LKVDSALTDVGWGVGGKFHRVSLHTSQFLTSLTYIAFSNKILTSSRNGELVIWDLNKPGSSKVGQSCLFFPFPNLKYKHKTERRTKDHIRSIHQLSISSIVHYYCVTGGADGDVRVWVSFPSLLSFLYTLWILGFEALSFFGVGFTSVMYAFYHRDTYGWVDGCLVISASRLSRKPLYAPYARSRKNDSELEVCARANRALNASE
jgi:WD40 repeat protein